MLQSLVRIVVALAVVYALATVVLWRVGERLIFLPHPASYRLADGYLRLPTARGDTVAARYVANPGARYTVVFSHGNAEDLGDDGPFLGQLAQAGFSVLAYDYPGYGASTGTPTEAGAYVAADAAYDYATQTLGIPAERIIIHGRSLGGAVAVNLASRRPSAGLVLESTFTSASRVGFGVRPFVFERFNSIARVPLIRCPTLVMHGEADRVIPFAHGRALFAALRVRKDSLWVPGAGHNDLALVAGDRYWTALKTFAASLPTAPTR